MAWISFKEAAYTTTIIAAIGLGTAFFRDKQFKSDAAYRAQTRKQQWKAAVRASIPQKPELTIDGGDFAVAIATTVNGEVIRANVMMRLPEAGEAQKILDTIRNDSNVLRMTTTMEGWNAKSFVADYVSNRALLQKMFEAIGQRLSVRGKDFYVKITGKNGAQLRFDCSSPEQVTSEPTSETPEDSLNTICGSPFYVKPATKGKNGTQAFAVPR